MRTNAMTWSAGAGSSAAPSLRRAWERAPLRTRCLGIAGVILAFGLLCGFYAVVLGGVHRAQAGREQARFALEHQAVCSAFATAASRDLCAVMVAAREAPGAVVHASYEQPGWAVRKPELSARLY
ncbi:MAG TPA: hypothetical protein VF308_01555 [Caldimonas sp.]